MSAHFQPPAKAEREDQLDLAHHWRGACLQEFSEMELHVGSALQLLARTKTSARVKVGQPIRPAIEELKRLTAARGAFAKAGKGLRASLLALESHLDWRAHLTHGVLDVWQGRKGQWLMTLHYRETNNSGPIRWHAMTFEDSRIWVETLAGEVRKLAQRCEALKRQLTDSD